MLAGEQPGDQEGRQGLPFVGAAGKLLLVTLGASAAKALLGASFRLTHQAGRTFGDPQYRVSTT